MTNGSLDDLPGDESQVDGFLRRGSLSYRRWIFVGGALAILVLAGISIALAWRQYDDAKSRALSDLDARVVVVSAIVDTYFRGEIATLDSISKAPVVVNRQPTGMNNYFRRVQPPGGKLFSAGLGWLNLHGRQEASSNPRPPTGTFAGRQYFQRVVATREPFVSAGLIGRTTKQPLVVIATPTFDIRGRLTGVLVGGILLKTVGQSKQSLDLGYGNLQIIDRDGKLLLGGLTPVTNKSLLGRIQGTRTGVDSSTHGLDGQTGHVVAYATSQVPGWVTVIDRPRSTVFAAARRSFVLELASVGAAVLVVFLILAFMLRRSRTDTEAQTRRARSWSGLTRGLGAAANPAEISDALLAALVMAFGDAVAIVSLESRGSPRIRAASRLVQDDALVRAKPTLETIAELGKTRPTSRLLDHEPLAQDIERATGRRLRAIHALPILDDAGSPVGTISLLSPAGGLADTEWALLESFADQAGQAFERTVRFLHEHELALRLQRSLLPERLPSTLGVDLAGHYQAGGEAVEVGGDWYDAVRRPDGIIQLCVGDVSGRGIGAATIMGRQRNTFHAYAFDCVSPAEIIRRMLRHVRGDEMLTVACVSLDPYTGELAYACAGHLPPLLLDRDSREVVRLDRASSPPFGVADPADIIEAHLSLPEHAVLGMYTDGLIERRGENIDDGVDLLGLTLSDESIVTPDGVVSRIGDTIGAPVDDVALLVVTLDLGRTEFDIEVPAEPGSLAAIRRRLGAWLARRNLDESAVSQTILAVSEACNNAIEHGNRPGKGTLRVSVSETPETIRFVIADQGTWRTQAPGAERGRGILLMRELMDSAEIETGPDGTRVTLERALPTRAPAARAYAPSAT